MTRIFKNKTSEEVGVSYGTVTQTIDANSQYDLSLTFESWQLAASKSLIELIGQGVDKYQLNDGINDLSVSDAIDLLRGYSSLKDSQGAPYVSLLLGKPGLQLCIKGSKFDAPANQSTDDDISFAEDREIQGSWFEVLNHQPGDYVEFFVCMPDGTPVGQFGETVYVPPDGTIDQIVSEGTAPLPAGIKLRFRYVAINAGVTRIVYVYHRMRK